MGRLKIILNTFVCGWLLWGSGETAYAENPLYKDCHPQLRELAKRLEQSTHDQNEAGIQRYLLKMINLHFQSFDIFRFQSLRDFFSEGLFILSDSTSMRLWWEALQTQELILLKNFLEQQNQAHISAILAELKKQSQQYQNLSLPEAESFIAMLTLHHPELGKKILQQYHYFSEAFSFPNDHDHQNPSHGQSSILEADLHSIEFSETYRARFFLFHMQRALHRYAEKGVVLAPNYEALWDRYFNTLQKAYRIDPDSHGRDYSQAMAHNRLRLMDFLRRARPVYPNPKQKMENQDFKTLAESLDVPDFFAPNLVPESVFSGLNLFQLIIISGNHEFLEIARQKLLNPLANPFFSLETNQTP